MATPTKQNIKQVICGVCLKPITNNECFKYSHPDPEKAWRHKACGPGSKAWTTKHGESEIGKMLSGKSKGASAPTKTTKTSKTKDPILASVKAFCGRDKYLRYMDTISPIQVWWTIDAEINGHNVKSSKDTPPLDMEKLYATVIK